MRKILLLLLLSSFFLAIPVLSQEYQQLIEKAYQVVNNGEFDDGEELFLEARDIDPDLKDSYLGLGYVYSLQKNWPNALEVYEELEKKIPADKEVIYQLAICNRQDGRVSNPISKIFRWKKAKEYFEKLISIDPLYREVYNEYALLCFYQEKFDKAINLAKKQIELKPEVSKPKIDIFKYYRYFINYASSDSDFLLSDDEAWRFKWLRSNNSDYDRFFIAEKHRLDGNLKLADSLLKRLGARKLSISKVPVYLSHVRLNFESGNNLEGERLYNKALRECNHFYEVKFIFDDLKYILADEDLNVHFPTIRDVKNYYYQFWKKKNPMPAAQYNVRIAEHYRRLVYAEKNYSFDGMRHISSNPDRQLVLNFPRIYNLNSRFNDKGLIYIRFGPSDQTANYSGNTTIPNESWLFYATAMNPKLIFHFEIHPQAPPGDWRLVPVPSDKKMLESRLGWDGDLDAYYTAHSFQDEMSVISNIQVKAEKNVKRALISERPFSAKEINPLPVHLSLTKFLNELDEPYYDISMAIAAEDIFEIEEMQTVNLEAGIAVQDTTYKTLFKDRNKIRLSESDKEKFVNGYYLDTYKAFSGKENFILSVYLQDKENKRMGNYRLKYRTEAPQNGSFAISGLQLAYSVEMTEKTDKFTHLGHLIIPNPTTKFRQGELLYCYYEIYNLKLRNGISSFKIEQTIAPADEDEGIISKFFNLFSSDDKQRITITKDHQSSGKIAPEYTAFDFKTLDSGTYTLTIRITDENTKKSVEAEKKFIIF